MRQLAGGFQRNESSTITRLEEVAEMQGYDLFMLVVLVVAVVWGFWKGLAWQVASIASLVVSYFVSVKFRAPMTNLLNQSIEIKAPYDTFLAMLVLFLATSLVVWVAFNLIADVIEKVKLKEFDHQLGALLGMAKGVLLCAIITLFGLTLLSEAQRQLIAQSKSGRYIAILLDRAGPLMPEEVHEALAPYIKNLDEQIQYTPTEDTLNRASSQAETADKRSIYSSKPAKSLYAPANGSYGTADDEPGAGGYSSSSRGF